MDAGDVHLNANADTVMKELNGAPKRSVHVLTPPEPENEPYLEKGSLQM